MEQTKVTESELFEMLGRLYAAERKQAKLVELYGNAIQNQRATIEALKNAQEGNDGDSDNDCSDTGDSGNSSEPVRLEKGKRVRARS